MKYTFPFVILLSLTFFLACDKTVDPPVDEIPTPEGYSLVWNDEFNGSSIDLEKWVFELGDGTNYGLPAGWGNNELQLYTDAAENARIDKNIEESSLFITALDKGGSNYTSAKLTTQNIFSMRFGRVDIRAKLPVGQGLWPAIWMLGDNRDQIDWPGCGEIDIVELLGQEPNVFYSTLHYTNSENKHGEIQNKYTLSSGNFNQNYHEFTLDWTPEYLTLILDGVEIQQAPIEEDMKEFLRSFYLIVNVAVGGYWPGNPDNTTVFPQTMAIDYIRVYSKDGFEAPASPTLDIDEETVGQVIEPNIGDNAIQEGFTEFGNVEVVSYGGGGEPIVGTSVTAVDGELSLEFDYPGTNWGGGYIQLETPQEMSAFTTLHVALNLPVGFTNAEIKLESPSSNAIVYLKDYSGTATTNGFTEYTIPLSDFAGLKLNELSIPLSIWNPQDANENFVAGKVLIDKLYLSK